jgi:hypothetical protein
MKFFVLVASIGFISMAFVNSAAVKDIKNKSATAIIISDSIDPKKDKGFICEISAGKKNTLWMGVENHVTVKLNGISHKDIEVKVSGGSVRATETEGEYAITLPKEMKEGEMAKISVIKTKSKESIGSSTFNVKNLVPKAVLTNGKSEGSIGSGELRIQTAVIVMFKDADMNVVKEKCQITQFTFTCYPGFKRADPVACTNIGSKFDEIALQLIQMPISGDKIAFTGVRGKCPGDIVDRVFNDLTFRIK